MERTSSRRTWARRARAFSQLVAASGLLAFSVGGAAAPAPGEPLPDVRAPDVTGRERHLLEAIGGERTLMVAITDRHADDEMRAWFDAADRNAPADVNRVSIVALSLPFFVSSKTVRSKAREEVPKQYWGKTFVAARGDLDEQLGLGKGRTPWAFVIDSSGRVVERVHATVGSAEASRIWAALRGD